MVRPSELPENAGKLAAGRAAAEWEKSVTKVEPFNADVDNQIATRNMFGAHRASDFHRDYPHQP